MCFLSPVIGRKDTVRGPRRPRHASEQSNELDPAVFERTLHADRSLGKYVVDQ
jgi:hypothetical protein